MRKILILPVAVAAIVLAIVSMGVNTEEITENKFIKDSNSVSITMSSSRPGCESTDTCYVPNELTINSGESVTWINDDSAFHTVTSGYYDEFDGLFDSQQLDPSQKFSHEFSEPGQFQYYCKLHPWMEGKIIVN